MDKITDFLNNFSLEKYVPKLDSVMGWVQWLVSLAVRVGPICILVLGLIYLLIPPKEANHKAGYRTYFGMGSVMAWRFTQRAAGILMSVTGLILTIIAYTAVGKFPDMDLMTMADKAFSMIKLQVICALVIYIVMFVLTAVLFDRKGNSRFSGKTNLPLDNLIPDDEEYTEASSNDGYDSEESYGEADPEAGYEPEDPDPEVAYERQGEQVITVEDIVIEGLDE